MGCGKNIHELEKNIGYAFANIKLLEIALTHSSFANEKKARSVILPCNERMEFLGDAVLQLTITEYLYQQFKDFDEGYLTKMRQSIVCEASLSAAAKSFSLGDFLSLGKGEEQTQGRNRNSVLADAFEAVLGAVYLDTEADMAFLRLFVLRLLEKQIRQCSLAKGGDYKSRLQQLIQQASDEHLEYNLIGESGPDHNKKFVVEALINSNVFGQGEGHTIKEAEQMAAKAVLSHYFGANDCSN